MKRYLQCISVIIFLLCIWLSAGAQTDQTVNNGGNTAPANFPTTGCTIKWTNNNPGIGLAATGTGNIPSFKAVNTGANPVTATVTATSQSGGYAYIANSSSSSVSVIDLATNKVTATIPVGQSPIGVAIGPDGNRVYITNQGSFSISVINAITNKVIATVSAPPGSDPSGITASRDGKFVYVSYYNAQSIGVIDAKTNTVIKTIVVGANPWDVALSPDGSKLYVANLGENTVSVINTAGGTVTATIPVGTGPNGLSLSADGKVLYVSNVLSNDVSVINTTSEQVVATIKVGTSPVAVVVNADGSRVYTSNIVDNTVSVINTATNSVIATIPVGDHPNGISLSPNGGRLYVNNENGKTISVINTVNNSLLPSVTVGFAPFSVGRFISAGHDCISSPISFTITVNPTAIASVITSGPVSGIISTCIGSPSATPNIQQFTVSGNGLTGNITATAPSGFEISLTPNSGYGKTATITQSAGSVNNKIVYVRSAAADPAGNISGNVTLSSPGALGQNVTVSGVVNAIPVVNPVTSQMVNEGEITTAINFTGTGNTYSWTNNTPGIGLPASGTGNITAFTAVNNSASAVTATITVTPHTAGYAYIANYGSNTISVVNTANNTVAATIPVGTSPWGVSVSRDGTRVYVSNQGSNNVSVINTAGNSVVATIPVGTMPEGIVVSPDGTRVYVTTLTGSGITVINATNNTVINGTIHTGSNPQGITLSSDGSKLYVVNAGDNTFSIVNTGNNAVVATIPVGSAPSNAVVTPDGRFVYVTNRGESTISVINTTTNAVIATIPVGNNPTGIAVSPDGTKVYSSDSNSSSVSVINTATNMVVSTITANYTPDGISVSADGTTLYVAGFSVDQLLIINAATGALLSTVDVGRNPGSAGNFLATGSLCPGAPVTFTITVAPTAIPVITATGSINALTTTYGTPSVPANFNVSGAGMTAGILVTPPPGFEVSTDNINFSPAATIGAAGTITPTTVYIRLAQTTNAGSYSGNIVLSSNGATSVNVATANSTVDPAPLTITANNVDKPFGTVLTGGPGSTAFSPFGLQNNEIIGSVTITYTAGAAATDPPNFYPGAVTASNATGGTFNPANYIISYVRGGVTVIVPSTITATGTLDGLTTTYGTPSLPGNFSVSGAYLSSPITVTPPAGFEVSVNNINFSSTITIGGSGNVSNTVIYVRLAATTPVGDYSGNFVMTSTGVPDAMIAIPNSTVNPASLVIAANDQEKYQGQPNPAVTVTYYGFVNNEGPSVFTKPLTISTTATANSAVGSYPIVAGNAEAPNYIITFLPGTLTVKLSPLTVQIPNAFTPNGDGVNDVWNIESLSAYPQCLVSVYSRNGNLVFQSRGYAIAWDGTYKGSLVPVGTYYYVIDTQPGTQELAGYVAVLR